MTRLAPIALVGRLIELIRNVDQDSLGDTELVYIESSLRNHATYNHTLYALFTKLTTSTTCSWLSIQESATRDNLLHRNATLTNVKSIPSVSLDETRCMLADLDEKNMTLEQRKTLLLQMKKSLSARKEAIQRNESCMKDTKPIMRTGISHEASVKEILAQMRRQLHAAGPVYVPTIQAPRTFIGPALEEIKAWYKNCARYGQDTAQLKIVGGDLVLLAGTRYSSAQMSRAIRTYANRKSIMIRGRLENLLSVLLTLQDCYEAQFREHFARRTQLASLVAEIERTEAEIRQTTRTFRQVHSAACEELASSQLMLAQTTKTVDLVSGDAALRLAKGSGVDVKKNANESSDSRSDVDADEMQSQMLLGKIKQFIHGAAL